MDELERALRAVLDDPAQLQELRALAGSLGLGQPDAAAPQEAAVPPMPPPAPPPAQPPKPPVQETVSLPEPAAAMLRQAGKADKKQEALLLALKPFLRKDRQSKIDRALQAAGQDIRGHRLAGDWRLYIEVLLQPGAQVVYVPRSLNVHRRHAQGVTQSLAAERHLDEVHGIHRHVAERLDVSPQILRQQADYLARLKQQLMPGAPT